MTRDFSRTLTAKRRAQTARAERRAKSARIFLCIAFPPALDAFQSEAR